MLAVNGSQARGSTFINSGTIAIGVPTSPGGSPGFLSAGQYSAFELAGGSVVETGTGFTGVVMSCNFTEGYGTIDVSGLDSGRYIRASGGLLSITTNGVGLVGSGTLQADPGATLSLAGAVSSSVSVSLSSTGTFITTAADAGLKIKSPAGGNLTITGGGTATLNTKDTNLTVTLAAASTLTLSTAGTLTAIGSTGADTIVAEAAGQTLEGKAGSDTLLGYTGAGDTFLGTASDLNGDTIGSFIGTDVIDVTDLMPGAGLSLSYTPGIGQGKLTLTEGAQSTTITLLGAFTQSQFTTTSDGANGVLIHVGT